MMTHDDFQQCLQQKAETIKAIRTVAHQIHADVNQTYGEGRPYSLHLDMVADAICRFGHAVCRDDKAVLPLVFGAYFHDCIEDARLDYNDVVAIARRYMDEIQAYDAAEIVYALTNEKGRTRAERAGERYYEGIRQTPYAPFVKLADRLANMTYSYTHDNDMNLHMREVYRNELPHFLQSIRSPRDDERFLLPSAMVNQLKQLIDND